MKPSSKILLWIALLLVFVTAAFVLLRQPAVSDSAQIAAQLETARAAGERHDVGGVMRVFSDHYHDANVPSPVQLRFLLNKVQGTEAIKVTQSLSVINVTGDTATSTTHLSVVSQSDSRVLYNHDITFQWQREDGTRLGVIPTKVWRIVTANYGNPFGDF